MAGYTLKSKTPDRLTTAVIAGNVFVLDVLVDIVGKLEKLASVLQRNASLAEVVVRLPFGFEALVA